jgi:hypothetical protein
VAHRGNVSLVKDQLGGMPQARAELGVIVREGEHVVARVGDSAEDASGLCRKGLGQLFGEVRRRQHAEKIAAGALKCESPRRGVGGT